MSGFFVMLLDAITGILPEGAKRRVHYARDNFEKVFVGFILVMVGLVGSAWLINEAASRL